MSQNNHDDDRTRSFAAIGIGDMVSHYHILDKIGAGGMGEVFLAEDSRLNRRVALKFLPVESANDKDYKARFLREAQAAAALEHQNIIVVYEVGEFRDRPFIVMQYLKGESLRDIIKARKLSLIESIDLAMQVGTGLDKAHAEGIVHRDIKPSNIMIDSDGQTKILDFGLAVFHGGHDLTRPGSTLGTVGYMSPEQVRGEKADHRSDIFSLGVLLYEMLTGRAPFRKNSEAATSQAVLNENPDPAARFVADLPDQMQGIIDKCLEKDRETRYQHIDEFLADLKRLQREIDSRITQTGLSSRPGGPALKSSLIGLMAVAVLILILTTVFPAKRQSIMRWIGLASGTTTRHLAVLPFENIGSENRAFCDGLLETLTCKISQMEQYSGGLRVVPASDVRQVGITSAREARKAFAVTHVVAGSVLNMGDSIRIIINIADTKTERLINSKEIVGSNLRRSSIQDSVILGLASMLEIYLPPDARHFLMIGGSSAPEAYDYYLLGRGYFLRSESLHNIDTAIGLFHQALGKDPKYAPAYSGLADAYWIKYDSLGEQTWIMHARDNCRQALALDGQLLDMYVLSGKMEQVFGEYEKSIMDFETALYLDSTCHEAHFGLANAYTALNMPKSAEASFRKAIEIKPDFWECYEVYMMHLFYQGRRDDAYSQLDNIASRESMGFVTWNNLGALNFMFSRPEKARTMWERSLEVAPNYGAYSNLGMLDQWQHRYREAAEMYEQALELNNSNYQVVGNLASAYYWIPDHRERSISVYQQAIIMAEEKLTINPRNFKVLTDLTEYYAAVENNDRAVSMAQQALLLAPENWDVLMRIGVAYETMGRRDSALILLAGSLERGGQAAYLEDLPELSNLRDDPRYEQLLYTSEESAEDTTSDN